MSQFPTDEHVEPTPEQPEAPAEGAPEAAVGPPEPPAPEPATGPRLVLKRAGQETDQVFAFTPPAVIGRFDPSVGPVDVDLGGLQEGVYVSRKHARITCEDGVYRIHDLGSSNGTYVLRGDFERVEEAELRDGAEIALGNARFMFRCEAGQADEAPVEEAAAEEPTSPPASDDPNVV